METIEEDREPFVTVIPTRHGYWVAARYEWSRGLDMFEVLATRRKYKTQQAAQLDAQVWARSTRTEYR